MSKSIPNETLRKDEYVLNQIETFPDYKPVDARYAAPNLRQAQVDLSTSERKVQQIITDLAAARDDYAAKSQTFHSLIDEAKIQVKAQYGSDSNQVHAIGLVKKTERKKPTAKKSEK